jgi:transcription initiation factor TFIIIB Brf1 subunit/transcription initiation factor TFIIB
MLHKWDQMPYKERSLHKVFKLIQDCCRREGIKKCVEDEAKGYYKYISEKKHASGKNKGKSIIIRGRNRTALIAACVYYSCKNRNMLYTPQEIAKIFKIQYTDITKGCKRFAKLYDIDSFDASTPEEFIERFCKKLSIKKSFMNLALIITLNTKRLNIATEHTPISIATGSILLMIHLNNLKITKQTLAKTFDTSEVTISKTYDKIYPLRKILTSNERTQQLIVLVEKQVLKERVRTYFEVEHFFSSVPFSLSKPVSSSTLLRLIAHFEEIAGFYDLAESRKKTEEQAKKLFQELSLES